MIKVANAPVSFGVFELTAGSQRLPDPDDILGAVARGGYDGIDLGPLGYLGRETIAERLERHGLSLAGGWIAMRLASTAAFEDDLPALEDALDVFEAAACLGRDLPPKPTLADAGSLSRWHNPGRAADMPEIGLDDEGWATLAKNLVRVIETCRARGLEPTFHHHACTYVETPHEIERLLDATDIGLCLDSGHLVLGGGDPVDALTRWGDRINHIHVKDCRIEVLHDVIEAGEGMEAVWRRAAFCELGAGDVDVDGFLEAVRELGYAGWLVVEQDTMSAGDSTLAEIAALQSRNREFLRERGF